ncbi:MAG TPA: hypothetical protein VH436_03210 [Vicinamibacterales bacterium]
MTRWAKLSYAYAALVALGVGYFLYDLPIQVTDCYGNMVKAAQGTLASLVTGEFHQVAYLRPLGWAQLRILMDASRGHYYEWFRGWHVVQIVVLVVLFLRLVRPRTLAGAAVVPLGLAALIGIHTFAGTVRESFPVNMFLMVLICSFAAADLALGPPRPASTKSAFARGDAKRFGGLWRDEVGWRDVAAALIFVFAVFSVESGILVAVVFWSAFLVGARGVSRIGVAAQVLLVIGYLVLRFSILHIGSPGLEERTAGYGFSRLETNQLIEKFGARPLPFYAYNVASSVLSIAFSEPREGMWVATRDYLRGETRLYQVVNFIASVLGSALILRYIWRRRREWIALRFNRSDQLVFIFLGVMAANATVSYAYTKDSILSLAGAFFAVALAVATQDFIESMSGLTPVRAIVPTLLLVVLSTAWSFRAIDAHMGLRVAAAKMRVEWAYVDSWLERNSDAPRDPAALALKQHLQDDAVRHHPLRPTLKGVWVERLSD